MTAAKDQSVRVGELKSRVPRDRKGEFQSQLLPEGKGRDAELEAFLVEVFLAGCSTRDLERISAKYLGQKHDSKQISRMVARATTELEAWRQRRLEGRCYKFVYLDCANLQVRMNQHVAKQSFYAVLGVSEEAEYFEVLALEMGDRERSEQWEWIFRSLTELGLNREALELGVMDGLPGLETAFCRFFPRVQAQRCQKHAKANACRWVRKRERKEFSKDVNKIF